MTTLKKATQKITTEPLKTVKPPRPTLNPVLRSFWETRSRNKVLYGGRSSSKCLAIGTLVIMADYTLSRIEDVRVGDFVMGDDGTPREVLHTTRGHDEMYRVSQHNGEAYIVNKDHILSLKRNTGSRLDRGEIMPSGNYRRPLGRYPQYGDILNLNVVDYMNRSDKFKSVFRGYKAGQLEFKERQLPVDPYFLGLWLGDGCYREPVITTMDREIKEFCYDYAQKLGVTITERQTKGKAYDLYFKKSTGQYNPLWKSLISIGVAEHRVKGIKSSSKKHVPHSYLVSSVNQRLELLAGLIDSDGCVTSNTYCITQVDDNIANSIARLSQSLGFRTTITKQKTTCNGVKGVTNSISISGDIDCVPVRLERKRVAKIESQKDPLATGIKVEHIGRGEYAGFSIDGNHLFLLADHTVTHNSWDAAGHAIRLANNYKLRFLCVRQLQNKIEESVYSLLKIQIERFGLQHRFKILENKIVNIYTGSEFIFYGLWRHIEEIKSIESIDVLWSEESHGLTKKQWEILEPTIRKEGSECWIIFNPDLVSDFVWQNFVVNPPPSTIVRKINYTENGFLSETILKVINAHKVRNPDDFPHIYLGEPRTNDERSIIKSSWVLAAIDAHKIIKGMDKGASVLGFDVADDGQDKCATTGRKGSVTVHLDEWKASEDELLKSCSRAYKTAQKLKAHINYDSIGVGATCGAKFKELNDAQKSTAKIAYSKFNAGGKVNKPNAFYIREDKIKNSDFFANLKAQSWWSVADRFRLTYQVVTAIKNGTEVPTYKIDELISICSNVDFLEQLKLELSIPLQDFDNNGRVKVESKKDLAKRDVPSPNIADSFIMAYAPIQTGLKIHPSMLA